MLKYMVNWTVFDAPTQTLVNTVNCVGVMGKGLALEVKRRFPEVYPKYRRMCERGELIIGKLQLVKTNSRWVLNFPTKNHWRGKSKINYIEKGLKKFASTYKRKGIMSIAFPPLGCGSGGLKWEHVRPIMERHLAPLRDIDIYVCLASPRDQRTISDWARRRDKTRREPHVGQFDLPFHTTQSHSPSG